MLTCPTCAQQSPDGSAFCSRCGTQLTRERLDVEERKIVSVLFVDLVGFTSRSEQLDPEDVSAMLRPYHARLRQEIEGFGGTVEKFVGDAVMAVFGAPATHEDDAERAVRAALVALEAIDDLNSARPELGLAVRAAVNTGEAIVTLGARPAEGEGIVTGDVVNSASRLQEVAPIGTVLVGELTYRATRSVVEYEELKPVSVKGKAEPVPVWRARAARVPLGVDVPPAAGAPFVNRQDELALLRGIYTRTLRESAVQLVTVVGEPGIGKTRLLLEFHGFVNSDAQVGIWRRGRCLPYGEGITFWALGEVVKAEAGIFESDNPKEALAKLGAAVENLVGDGTEREWLIGRLAPLVGLVAAGESSGRTESFTAWRRFLEALGSTRPLVLVLEDLHWADAAMLEFVEHLVDWSTSVPILVLCTARPELFELSPGWGGGKRNSTTIALSPLTIDETTELVSALLEPGLLAPEIETDLVERCGGNPLYAEEFAHMLGELDPSNPSAAAAPVPDTIQAVIAARLDTLPPARKALLQDAAVLGKSFWSGAVAAMAGLEEQTVRTELHELARKELIRDVRGSAVEGQDEYSFWHIVVRDVAYGQIPRSKRARKHRLAAEWIEGLAADRVVDHAEWLAHHYGEAIALARVAGTAEEALSLEAPALRCHLLAGDRAMRLDRARAEWYYRRALELAPEGNPHRPAVLAKVADADFWAGRYAQADRTYAEAIADFKARHDFRSAGEAIASASFVAAQLGDIARAQTLVAEAIELLESEPPSGELAFAYASAARNEMMASRSRSCIEWATKAIELADRLGVHGQAVRARQFRGFARVGTGDKGGIDELREALQMGLELGLGFETVTAYQNLAHASWYIEGPQKALELAKTAIELGERRGLDLQVQWGKVETLKFIFDLGDWDALMRTANELQEPERAVGLSLAELWTLPYVAYVLFVRGDHAQAAALTEEVIRHARAGSGWQSLVPDLALAALIHARAGDARAAVEHVQELIELTAENPVGRAQHLADAVRACCDVDALPIAEAAMAGADERLPRSQHSMLTARAIVAEARGELAESAGLYAEAWASWADFGFTLERGQSSLGRGRCLLALRRPKEAIAALLDAERVFRALAAGPLLGETADLRDQARRLKA
jgi:class 3 adenylate cyclase/tetratricopeptide (TPR) repeat protein